MAADGNELSARTKRLRGRGMSERTIDEVPERDGLRGFENARPNAQEPEKHGDLIRGGRED